MLKCEERDADREQDIEGKPRVEHVLQNEDRILEICDETQIEDQPDDQECSLTGPDHPPELKIDQDAHEQEKEIGRMPVGVEEKGCKYQQQKWRRLRKARSGDGRRSALCGGVQDQVSQIQNRYECQKLKTVKEHRLLQLSPAVKLDHPSKN